MRLYVLQGQVIVLLLALFLQACGTSSPAPVTDLSRASSYNSKEYTVVKGDTLYSIAWRYDLDFRKLAKSNGIPSPYLITPGQRIVLSENSSYIKKQPVSSSISTARREPAKEKRQVVENDRNITKKAVETENVVKQYPAAKRDKGWLWPVSGKVVERFSLQKNNKGIDIAAATGTPVIASRSGHVVYSGSQLKGYGNLVIVRHDETYLSAYAHNSKVLVKEGQVVKQGQKIAEVGNTGTQNAKLHFEIRKQGKPVNPLPLLQKK